MTNRQTANEKLLEALVHNPAQCSNEHIEWAQALQDSPGVTWDIPRVDEHLIPAHPGDMVVFVARPAQGKTSMLAYHALHEARRIQYRREIGMSGAEDEIVLYVSWEQLTQEVDAYFHINEHYCVTDIVRGNVDMETVKMNTISYTNRVQLPIWLMGESLNRTTPNSVKMTTDVVEQAVRAIYEDYHKKVTLICADYLQLVPVARASDLVFEVTHAADLLKHLGKRCGCPTFIGVQARQEVDDYEIKLPRQRDGQWASRIFQTCDKWFSIWRPWSTDADNQNTIKWLREKQGVEMSESLFLVQKLKERNNKSAAAWCLHFEPQFLKLCELERELTEPVYI